MLCKTKINPLILTASLLEMYLVMIKVSSTYNISFRCTVLSFDTYIPYHMLATVSVVPIPTVSFLTLSSF